MHKHICMRGSVQAKNQRGTKSAWSILQSRHGRQPVLPAGPHADRPQIDASGSTAAMHRHDAWMVSLSCPQRQLARAAGTCVSTCRCSPEEMMIHMQRRQPSLVLDRWIDPSMCSMRCVHIPRWYVVGGRCDGDAPARERTSVGR